MWQLASSLFVILHCRAVPLCHYTGSPMLSPPPVIAVAPHCCCCPTELLLALSGLVWNIGHWLLLSSNADDMAVVPHIIVVGSSCCHSCQHPHLRQRAAAHRPGGGAVSGTRGSSLSDNEIGPLPPCQQGRAVVALCHLVTT
jgi:hypothetical protein